MSVLNHKSAIQTKSQVGLNHFKKAAEDAKSEYEKQLKQAQDDLKKAKKEGSDKVAELREKLIALQTKVRQERDNIRMRRAQLKRKEEEMKKDEEKAKEELRQVERQESEVKNIPSTVNAEQIKEEYLEKMNTILRQWPIELQNEKSDLQNQMVVLRKQLQDAEKSLQCVNDALNAHRKVKGSVDENDDVQKIHREALDLFNSFFEGCEWPDAAKSDSSGSTEEQEENVDCEGENCDKEPVEGRGMTNKVVVFERKTASADEGDLAVIVGRKKVGSRTRYKLKLLKNDQVLDKGYGVGGNAAVQPFDGGKWYEFKDEESGRMYYSNNVESVWFAGLLEVQARAVARASTPVTRAAEFDLSHWKPQTNHVRGVKPDQRGSKNYYARVYGMQ